MATPSLGQVEPDLAHRWRFSVGAGAADHDVANGVTIQRVGDDFATPQRLAGTIITVGDKKVGAADQSAWVTFDGGTPASGATPDPSFHKTLEYGGAEGGASAQDVSAGPFWTRREKHAHVVGWFDGTVDFGDGVEKTAGGPGTNGYLAFFREPTTLETNWVAQFSGGGDVRASAVDTSPKCRPAIDGDTDPEPYYPGARKWECGPWGGDYIVVGGSFDVSVDFFDYDGGRARQVDCGLGNYIHNTNGGEDGFVAIYSEGRRDLHCGPCAGGILQHSIAIGGEGDDRVSGVVIDPVSNAVIVTGFFCESADFNPNGSPHVKTAVGGREIFVARYTWDLQVSSGCPELTLDWVYIYGTPADDEGLDVAVDLNGDVYAVGYHTPSGLSHRRDMFAAKIEREQASMDAVADWNFNHHQKPGDQVATGVAVDGLDRVLVTGRFGCPHPVLCEHLGSEYDFDPGAGTDTRYSSGGADAFVARYYPLNGTYDGVFTFGGDQHDSGTDIATDPVHTQTVAHTGYFGSPGAPASGYTVDMDPDPGTTSTVESSGLQDGFCSLLRTDWITEDLKNMVAIVLDSTLYTRYADTAPGLTFDEFTKMTWTYAGSMGVDIPQDGSVAVAVFLHGLAEQYGIDPGMGGKVDEDRATQVMPWTVLDPITRPLFASRLAKMPRWYFENDQRLESGVTVAQYSIEDSPLSDLACFRSIHVLAGGPNRLETMDASGEMSDALQDALSGGFVDRVDGFAVPNGAWFGPPQTAREYLRDYATASDDPMQPFQAYAQTSEFISGVGWLSFADPAFESLVSRLLKRVAYCPADFDLDGDVDSFDLDAFNDAYWDPMHPDRLRADWNFDGEIDSADATGFMYSYAQGCCQ